MRACSRCRLPSFRLHRMTTILYLRHLSRHPGRKEPCSGLILGWTGSPAYVLPSDSTRDTMDGAHEAIPHGERPLRQSVRDKSNLPCHRWTAWPVNGMYWYVFLPYFPTLSSCWVSLVPIHIEPSVVFHRCRVGHKNEIQQRVAFPLKIGVILPDACLSFLNRKRPHIISCGYSRQQQSRCK